MISGVHWRNKLPQHPINVEIVIEGLVIIVREGVAFLFKQDIAFSRCYLPDVGHKLLSSKYTTQLLKYTCRIEKTSLFLPIDLHLFLFPDDARSICTSSSSKRNKLDLVGKLPFFYMHPGAISNIDKDATKQVLLASQGRESSTREEDKQPLGTLEEPGKI